jgi:hypothetical protein
MPKRFAELGDPHSAMDQHVGSIDALLELSERQEGEGLGDAPWPPHYRKQPGEPPRVQPSKSRARAEKYPLIEVSQGKDKKEALAGLVKWKKKHPRVAKLLKPADVLVDQMRGRSSAWYRIRINLQHVPEKLRPSSGAVSSPRSPRTPSRARKPE